MITTSPLAFHVVLFIVIAIIWIVVISRGRQKESDLFIGRRFRIVVFIGAITAIGFSAILVYAFVTKHIAGYEVSEEWEWLKNIQYSEPIYEGEWLGFFYLYLFPLASCAVAGLLMNDQERNKFFKVFFRSYPFILIASYTLLCVSQSVGNVRIERSSTPIERNATNG